MKLCVLCKLTAQGGVTSRDGVCVCHCCLDECVRIAAPRGDTFTQIETPKWDDFTLEIQEIVILALQRERDRCDKTQDRSESGGLGALARRMSSACSIVDAAINVLSRFKHANAEAWWEQIPTDRKEFIYAKLLREAEGMRNEADIARGHNLPEYATREVLVGKALVTAAVLLGWPGMP